MSERARRISIWDRAILHGAVIDSFRKLDPRIQVRNPVMFIVEVGSLITTVIWLQELAGSGGNPLFTGPVAFWLCFTVLFANFAEAMAEGRGKAQAATLRKTRSETMACRIRDGAEETVPASALSKIFFLLRRETGNDFTNYKRTTIARRLNRRMGLHKLSRVEDYVRYLGEFAAGSGRVVSRPPDQRHELFPRSRGVRRAQGDGIPAPHAAPQGRGRAAHLGAGLFYRGRGLLDRHRAHRVSRS